MSMNTTWAISSSIFFLTSADMSVASTGLRERYGLDSTADSREQSQKAPSRSLTTQLKQALLLGSVEPNKRRTLNTQHWTLNSARLTWMPAGESFRSQRLSPFGLRSGQAVERWAFSFEIALSRGTTSRISRQSDSRRQRSQDSARLRRV